MMKEDQAEYFEEDMKHEQGYAKKLASVKDANKQDKTLADK